jgi:hypothetical protein
MKPLNSWNVATLSTLPRRSRPQSNTLLKAGLIEEGASKWASYYVDVRDRLHGGCFYGLVYEEEEHKPLMEKAREYVDLVDKILRRPERVS